MFWALADSGRSSVIVHTGPSTSYRTVSNAAGFPDVIVMNVVPGAFCAVLRQGFGSRGSASTRSPMMFRWISFVPAQIDDAW